jgi:N6-adenosine-specific RNA methylase IME4
MFERVLHNQVSASTAARKVRRAKRDAAIPPPPPLPEGPFPLLYGDPPWEMGSPDSPYAPEQHYPTMPLHEIKALEVPAAENAILFLWAVTSLLPEALEVLEAWGFTYRSAMVWVKDGIGLGNWVRHRHEQLLIATKGAISPPDPEDRCDSVIQASRGLHSQKPLEACERIEQMYPQLAKLELFARGTPRAGWQIWGNQAQPDSEPGPESAPETEPA